MNIKKIGAAISTDSPKDSQKTVLSYSGGGKVSVSVASIVNSEKVQRQVAGVKQIEAALAQKK